MAKEKKKAERKATTVEKYRRWHRTYVATDVSKYVASLVPAAVLLGINWNEWFKPNDPNGWSIGMGFGMLLVSVLASVVAMMKRDEIVKSNLSVLFVVAIIFALVGFSFKLLASVMTEMGDMFLVVTIGILVAAGVDQVDKSYVLPKVKFYKKLVEDNGLTAKAAALQDDTEQAEREGKEAKAERKKRNNL